MTDSSFSIRGRCAIAAIKGEREIATLRRQLDHLGMTLVLSDITSARGMADAGDVVIVDTDVIPNDVGDIATWTAGLPVIALVGVETPSRLKCMLDLKPAAFLIKPLRSAGIFTALVVAFDHAARQRETAARIEKLEERVRARRVVLAAVLQTMRSFDLAEPDAFALIRRTAMQQRKTVEQLSADIMATGGFPTRTACSA